MPYLLLLGRILFTMIFFTSVPENFTKEKIKSVAANGLPLASVLVPIASVMAFIGASSILLGVEARWGAWLVIIFLVPVTFVQHRFWTIDDAMKRKIQYISFMKNVSIIGGAIFIAVFGSGPLSLDALF